MTNRAVIEHDPSILSAEDVVEMIDDVGFPAELVSSEVKGAKKPETTAPTLATTTMSVEGMTCGACTSAVEGAVKELERIVSFTVSLITERAVAVHDPKVVSAEEVAEA